MEDEKVDNDHCQHPSDSSLVGNEMKSGIEDHGLASDHCVPTDYHEGRTDVVVPA